MYGDLRQALRRLWRRKGVAAAAVVTLAVGVGAVTTAFALIDAILLAPLDYAAPQRLVRLYATVGQLRESPNERLAAMWNRLPVSYLRTLERRRRSRSLQSIGLFEPYRVVLEEGDEPQEVPAARVDAELLAALGVAPERGRLFSHGEAAEDRRLVLLGDGLWRSAFAADPAVVGRTVRLDGEPCSVVGVMPPGFALPGGDERLWTLLRPREDDLGRRDQQWYAAIGRLAPGVTLEAARREQDQLSSAFAADHPDTDADVGLRLVPLAEVVVGDSDRVLALLAVAAAVVLVLAAFNLAHLLLVQALDRQRELAMLQVLGAGRLRLLRAASVEGLILVVAGGCGGIALAAGMLAALPRLVGDELPRLSEVAFDGATLLFAAVAAAAAVGLAALLPARRVARGGLAAALAGGQGEGRGEHRAREVLVVAEVALALVLTSSALLLVVDWLHLGAADPGFDPGGVLVQEVHLPAWRYRGEVERGEFADRLLAALEALAGVRSAALSSRLPLPGPAEVWGFRIAGLDPPGGDWTQGRSATMQFVTPGFLRTLGIPLLAGRGFTAEDRGGDGRRVVLVDRRLARRHWPGGGAVGGQIVMGAAGIPYTVVGVVGDIQGRGPTEGPDGLMLQPWHQRPPARLAALVRAASGHPEELATAVRRSLRRLDPALALPPATALDALLEEALTGPRSQAILVALSAGVALLLTVVGTYGVTASGVARRSREMGVRLALGASRGQIHRLVLGRLGALALIGLAAGTAGSLASGRLLAGFLHGVTSSPPAILATVAGGLLVTCLAAAWLPARRAGRTDPAATIARG